MDWVKRKGTNGKDERCAKILEEKKFSFQRVIPKFVSEDNILLDLLLNLYQTLLSYVSPRKYTFDLKGSITIPLKSVDDKRKNKRQLYNCHIYSFCIRFFFTYSTLL